VNPENSVNTQMQSAQLTQSLLARQQIQAGARFDAAYVTMNILATTVASYGLLQDSASVIIGAMIIAMLLGPIVGMALALVDGNSRLMRDALLAETGGMLIVCVTAFLIGKLHQNLPLTGEMLGRTSPNILDLIIALAGGAAGAYAMISPRVSGSIVGVAISTALVPPLCTFALCLARGETRLALGGLLLFLTNLVAIQLAASIVLWLHGYHRVTEALSPIARQERKRNILISLCLLAALAVMLTYNFERNLSRVRYENRLRETLERELREFPGARLSELRIVDRAAEQKVYAIVRVPYSFTPEQVARIERRLPRRAGYDITLHLRAVITKETTRNGYQHEILRDQQTLPPQPGSDSGVEVRVMPE
jgi:uncharacterized hydrophobic protein (TIGR00271 family)